MVPRYHGEHCDVSILESSLLITETKDAFASLNANWRAKSGLRTSSRRFSSPTLRPALGR